ncbi:hypothetical protein ACX40Y_08455 [Sphingomonas sp. RS6]
MSGTGESITGVWYGRWSSDDPLVPPNRFIAVLSEDARVIEGDVSEPDLMGGEVLRSAVYGGRRDHQLQWIKQYDPAGRLEHSVYYAGRVDAEATRINGAWQFDRYSGTFSMYREKFALDEAGVEADSIDVTAGR